MELATDQRADFTDTLENHDHALKRIIEKKSSEAIQASKQVLAEEEAKLIRVAESYEKELSAVKDSNVANERKVAFLEDQLQKVAGQVQTIEPALTSYIHSETKKTIEDAERDSMRKLILTFTPSEHEALKELHDKFYDYEASVQKLLEVPAQISELKAAMKQQSDRLESSVGRQDEIISRFTTTHTSPATTGADAEISSKLRDEVDTHDKQLQELVKIPAAVNDLKAEFKALTELFQAPTTTSNVLSTFEDKLQEHDNQLKQLSGNQTTIETLVQQHEELETRLDKLAESTIGEQLKDQSILELERKFSIFETSIAEVGSIPSQINALDDRTKTLEAESTYNSELCKQLKTSIGEVETLTKSLASCEERVSHLETSMKSSADNLSDVKNRVPALEKQLRNVTTHVTGLRIDTNNHARVLDDLRKWVTEGEEDINLAHKKVKEVTASLEKLEADVREHIETLNGKLDGATMAIAKLELDAEFQAGFQQHGGLLNFNFDDLDMPMGYTDVPVNDAALPAEANNAEEAAPFASNGPTETLQQPSSFNANSFQNATFDFSFPVADPPPPPPSGNAATAFSAPVFPLPSAAPTTDALPASSWPNSPTPQEDMSGSGPSSPSNAESPLVDEQMKDWNAFFEEHGVPDEGDEFDGMIAGLGVERDEEDEMGSDRDAEGETDDEDAEFGSGY